MKKKNCDQHPWDGGWGGQWSWKSEQPGCPGSLYGGSMHAAVEEPGPVALLGSVRTHGAAAVVPRSVSFRPSSLGQKAEGTGRAKPRGREGSSHTGRALQGPQSPWFLLGLRFAGAARSGLPFACRLGSLLATTGLALSIWPLKGYSYSPSLCSCSCLKTSKTKKVPLHLFY